MAKKKKKRQSTPKGPVQKQRANVYTMMLISSFLALVMACVLMYMELKRYTFDYEAKEYKKSSQRPVATQTWLARL